MSGARILVALMSVGVAGAVMMTGCQGLFEDLGGMEFETEDPVDERLELSVVQEPPGEVVAGEEFAVEVVAERPDGTSWVGGLEATLSVSAGTFDDGEQEISGTTNADGEVVFSVRLLMAHSGMVLTASILGEEEAATVQTRSFDVVAAAAAEDGSWISAGRAVQADGEEEAEIQIVLGDAYGNPIVDVVPTFEASGEGNVYGACSPTDGQGLSHCTMASTTAETKELSITSPLTLTGESVEFWVPCDEGLTEEFGAGDGSVDDPFRICSRHHLQLVGHPETDRWASFAITRDLDLLLESDFEVIGDDEQPFEGRFDGRGFVIRNLRIQRPGENGVGLFGVVGEGGEVRDVHLRDVDVTGGRSVGGIAGINEGDIRGSSVSGGVIGEVTVGGLVGENHGMIRDSWSDAEVEGTSMVEETNNLDWSEVGGLVGRNDDLIARGVSRGTVSGVYMVGGLVGRNRGLVEESYSVAEVYGERRAGGFVGLSLQGDIRDSYATGAVTGEHDAGGFAGDDRGTLRRSYSSGPVIAEQGGSGFAARTSQASVHCFWDLDTSEHSTPVATGPDGGITGLTTEEFALEQSFGAQWDFGGIWVIGMAPDGVLRPIHRWEEEEQ